MTTADAVRRRLGLGRLLPLGEAADGAWLTEQAAGEVLRIAAGGVADMELGKVRLALIDPETAAVPAVPPPPSALPPGPLRIDAELAVTALRPLAAVTDALRRALFSAARDTLGLAVEAVDLRVTALLETAGAGSGRGARHGPPAAEPAGATGGEEGAGTAFRAGTGATDAVGRAVASVPGVAEPGAALGPAVRLAADHVRVEVATAPGHYPPAVARAVRMAVSGALGDDRPVSVLVTRVSL
ncbi:hypothetical protein [Streptomyces jumonjinensis]|uniref:Nucleopolyhedrovirus P10 family protein n=1 Tax=Streptomyces jumonjinensis TaxID=1945 RepID=A0A646KHF8_STRJU|nr:hypothetical protein [Streptomyces jumonjinensis]MQT01653.1 hypothetical protein [Streptomyces jumonjinensis]